MRKLVVAAWLAVTSIIAAVPAASQVSLPPLAPGEVLLEVNAVGAARSPATNATLTVTLSAQTESEDEARRAIEAASARVHAAARAAGIPAADIAASRISSGNDMAMTSVDMMNMTTDVMMNGADSTYGSGAYAGGTIRIRLRNPAGVLALQSRLRGIEHASPEMIEYGLEDDSAARRTARADAIRRARADAEAYAGTLNMRVARVLRVSERTPPDPMTLLFGGGAGSPDVLSAMQGAQVGEAEGQIGTYAVVGVDFALAPR